MDFSKSSPRFPEPGSKIARRVATLQAARTRLRSSSSSSSPNGTSSLGATTPQRESDLALKKQIFSPSTATSPLSRSSQSSISLATTTEIQVGDRVWIADRTRSGTAMFVGPTEFKKGLWVGIELDPGFQGRHDGLVEGHRYFTCKEGQGIFVPAGQVTRMTDDPTGAHDHASTASASPDRSPVNRRTSFGSPSKPANGTQPSEQPLAVSQDDLAAASLTPQDLESVGGVVGLVATLQTRLEDATRLAESGKSATFELKLLRDELDALRTMHITHEAEKEHMKNALDELRATLGEKDDLLSKLEARAFELEEKHISSASEDFHAVMDENARLKTEVAALKKRPLHTENGTKASEDSKWDALQDSMQELSKSIAVIQDKVSKWSASGSNSSAAPATASVKDALDFKDVVARIQADSARAMEDLKAASESRAQALADQVALLQEREKERLAKDTSTSANTAAATTTTTTTTDGGDGSLAALQEEMARLAAELAEAKVDRAAFAEQAQALQAALTAAQAATSASVEDLKTASQVLSDAYGKELDALRTRDAARTAEIQRLEGENSKLAASLMEREEGQGLASLSHDDAVQKLQAEVTELRAKLVAAEEDKASTAARLDQALQFTETVAKMQAESERLVAELKAASEERTAALTLDLAALREKQAQAEPQSAAGAEALQGLQRELEALAALVKGADRAGAEGSSSSSSSELKQQIERLHEASTTALEEIKAATKENADLIKSTVEAQKTQIAALEARLASTTPAADGSTTTTGAAADTANLLAEIASLRAAVAKAQEDKAAAEGLVQRATDFKDVVEKLQAESQRSVDEVKAAAQQREDALAKEVASLKEREAALQAEVQKLGEEKDVLTKAVAEERGGSSAALKVEGVELARLREDVARVTGELQAAGAESTMHKKDAERLQADVERLEADKARLEASLEEVRTSLAAKEQEVNELQREVEVVRAELEGGKKENAVLLEAASTAEAGRAHLAAQFTELREAVEQTRNALTDEALAEKTRDNAEKAKEIERLSKELQQLRDEKAHLASELSKAESMLFDAEHRVLEVKAASKHIVDFSALAQVIKEHESSDVLSADVDQVIAATLEELRRRATVCESQLELLVAADATDPKEESPFY